MRTGVRLLGEPLWLVVLLLAVASSAHALPFRQSGLRNGGAGGGAAENFVGAGEDRGVHSEQESLPPAPSHELLSEMKMHNQAFNYHYAFWNETELDKEGCSQLAQQLNSETARSDDAQTACVPHYSCDRDPLRYPQWLVFTSCTMGAVGGCNPAHPDSLARYRCFPHEEDILMLRYVTEQISRANKRSSMLITNGAANANEEKPAAREKGEWQLWFVQVPSECKCYL